MEIIVITAATILVSWLLRNQIKSHAVVFYAIAVAVQIVYIAGTYMDFPDIIWQPLFLLVQKCTLATALFIVVMYVGVLPKGSKHYLWLKGIRAELSILACILAMGHMIMCLIPYLPRILSGTGIKGNVLFSFVLAIALFVLILVLGITSFDNVKKKMSTATWIKVQKWAYLFYGLLYVHLMAMLLPSALNGGVQAIITTSFYTVVFVSYAVLRVRRAMIDRKAEEAGKAEQAEQLEQAEEAPAQIEEATA